MKVVFVASLALALSVTLGCSHSSDDSEHDGHSSSSSGSSGASSTSSSTSSSSGSSGTTAVEAPTLDAVEKMAGALHVMWANPKTACDKIEGERQAKMADGTVHEAYKVVFTVAGEADNKHDTTATDDMSYTYRLRCKKGEAYSPYSNEKSGNPKK